MDEWKDGYLHFQGTRKKCIDKTLEWLDKGLLVSKPEPYDGKGQFCICAKKLK